MSVTASVTGPSISTVGGITTRTYDVVFDLSAYDTQPVCVPTVPKIDNGGDRPVLFDESVYLFLYGRGYPSGNNSRFVGLLLENPGSNTLYRTTRTYTAYGLDGSGNETADITLINWYANRAVSTYYSSLGPGTQVYTLQHAALFLIPANVTAILPAYFSAQTISHIALIRSFNADFTLEFMSDQLATGWTYQNQVPSTDAGAFEFSTLGVMGSAEFASGNGTSRGKLSAINPPSVFLRQSLVSGNNEFLYGVQTTSTLFGFCSLWPKSLRDVIDGTSNTYQMGWQIPYYSGATYAFKLRGAVGGSSPATIDFLIPFKAYAADLTLLGTWNEPITVALSWVDGFGNGFYASVGTCTPSASVPANTRLLNIGYDVTYADRCRVQTLGVFAQAMPWTCIDGSWLPGQVG